MTLRTAALEETDRFRLKLQLDGITAGPECLPPDQRGMLDMLGLQLRPDRRCRRRASAPPPREGTRGGAAAHRRAFALSGGYQRRRRHC